MTDADLILKRLAFIETCLRELAEFADPDRVEHDVRERRFVEHTLQVMIQASLDIAAHIVASDRLGEPTSNYSLFELLEYAGWLTPALRSELARMAGFRNVLVHGYVAVDAAIVRDVLEHRLGDIESFVGSIRRKLDDARRG